MSKHAISLTSPSSTPSGIKLLMQQSNLCDVDDWTGVSDPKIRRRVQNRLNQRAYRYRKEKTDTHGEAKRSKEEGGRFIIASPDGSRRIPNISTTSTQAILLPSTANRVLQWTWAPSNLGVLMTQYESRATESYLRGSPQLDHLISLSRLNVWHAANANILALGMATEYLWADESISIFNTSANISNDTIPASLQPTALQRIIPHHPWFDVFPFPSIRDNFLRKLNDLDDDDLCYDIIGFWDNSRTDATLLVWGHPWDPLSWEVTEAFARKWGWTLQGCPEILKSTNHWRVRRGEKPLVWRYILSSA